MILTDNDLKRLPILDLEDLYHNLCDKLDSTVFKLWAPGHNSSHSSRSIRNTSRSNLLSIQDEYLQNILLGTTVAHAEEGVRNKIDFGKYLNAKLIGEVQTLLTYYKVIMDKYKMELLTDAEVKVTELSDEQDDKDELNLARTLADERYVAPLEIDDEKVLVTLQSSLFADIVKLNDKYSIRIGDGKYFVASDEIKVVLRDPSTRPSWAIWFLSAVPLEKIPSRASLLLMPEEERQKLYPAEIPDQLIVCHASLWKTRNKTGVLLHTSWNHVAATYRWVIDKPIDVASVLFKAVSHPGHLARNFGYTPNLAIPGDEWFL